LSTFPDRTKVAADIAKQMGIVLLTIGIANADLEELTYIASEPKCMRTFILDNFGALIEGKSKHVLHNYVALIVNIL
jgi:hypothetical protein